MTNKIKYVIICIILFNAIQTFAQSTNSQNDIGKSKSFIIKKYSKYYSKPKIYLIKNNNENNRIYSTINGDTALRFHSNQIEGHNVMCIFSNGVCYSQFITYPYGEPLTNTIKMYNEIFVDNGYLKWIEYTPKEDYSYIIEKQTNYFIIHIEENY